MFLDDFCRLLGLLWACFRMLLLGGLRPPRPPRSCLLCRESKYLPRTKPRQKIRTDAYNKTNISKLCSSKLLSLSQPSLLQKLWAAVLPPRGASITYKYMPLYIRRPSWRRAGGDTVYFLTSYFLRLYILIYCNMSYTFRPNINK